MGQGASSSFAYDIDHEISIPADCLPGRERMSNSTTNSQIKIHHGYTKSNKKPVSIWVFSNTSDTSFISVIKKLRHPHIVEYIDSTVIRDSLYVVTEPVRFLLSPAEIQKLVENPLYFTVGIYHLLTALEFLTTTSTQMYIRPQTIFLAENGGWKLCSLLPISSIWEEPNNQDSQYPGTSHIYALGCLIHYFFSTGTRATGQTASANASLYANPSTLISSINSLYKTAKNPALSKLLKYSRQMVGPLNRRPTLLQLKTAGLFKNPLVEADTFLETLPLHSPEQQDAFFRKMSSSIELLNPLGPKLLYIIIEAHKKSLLKSPQALALALTVGNNHPDVFPDILIPNIQDLFSINNRGIRISLLHHLESYISFMEHDNALEIFKLSSNGFNDESEALKDITVRSLIFLVPVISQDAKSSKEMINILKIVFPRLISDKSNRVRKNSYICLAKIGSFLSPTLNHVPLLMAGLRDPDQSIRKTCLAAFTTTCHTLDPTLLATKFLPNVCLLTIDQDPGVRTLALKIMSLGLETISEHSQKLALEQAESEPLKNPSASRNNDGTDTITAGVGSGVGSGSSGVGPQTSIASQTDPSEGWGSSILGWVSSRVIGEPEKLHVVPEDTTLVPQKSTSPSSTSHVSHISHVDTVKTHKSHQKISSMTHSHNPDVVNFGTGSSGSSGSRSMSGFSTEYDSRSIETTDSVRSHHNSRRNGSMNLSSEENLFAELGIAAEPNITNTLGDADSTNVDEIIDQFQHHRGHKANPVHIDSFDYDPISPSFNSKTKTKPRAQIPPTSENMYSYHSSHTNPPQNQTLTNSPPSEGTSLPDIDFIQEDSFSDQDSIHSPTTNVDSFLLDSDAIPESTSNVIPVSHQPPRQSIHHKTKSDNTIWSNFDPLGNQSRNNTRPKSTSNLSPVVLMDPNQNPLLSTPSSLLSPSDVGSNIGVHESSSGSRANTVVPIKNNTTESPASSDDWFSSFN